MRSLLFLPGNQPSMLISGTQLAADGIIIDLEDAVSMDEKDTARILARNAISFFSYPCPVIVRINGLTTPFWREDLREILKAKPRYIMVPKIECAEELTELEQELCALNAAEPISIIAMIETARGVMEAYHIAAASRHLAGLALGGEDLTADLGCQRTEGGKELLLARQMVVMAAKSAGLECYDTPYTNTKDSAGAGRDAAEARAMGFSGKLVISPGHLRAVNEAFTPTQAEVEFAMRVVQAAEEAKQAGKGAVSLDGKMIDKPVVLRAENILKMVGNAENG